MNATQSWKKKFITLSAGQIFSIIGSSAAQFAIIWWLTVETGSAITLSIASLVGYLPTAILGPFVGVWVDRYDRKKIMMLADSFVALVSAGLAVAYMLDAVTLPLIYGVLFLRALGSTFHGTAYQSVIPAFVPQDKLVKAGGWGFLVRSGAALLGPIIGAFLIDVSTLGVVMLVDIAGAMLAVGSLVFIKIPAIPRSNAKTSVIADIKSAVTLIRGNRQLVTLTASILMVAFIANPMFSLLSLMITQHFDGGVWHNTAARLCMTIGLLLGSAVLGMWGGSKRQFLLMSGAILVTGLGACAAGLVPGNLFALYLVCVFIIGLVNSGVNVPYSAYVQRTVEPTMLGKVNGLIDAFGSVALPMGFVISGPMAEYLGVARWFVVGGGILTAMGVYLVIKAKGFDAIEDAKAEKAVEA